MTRVKSLIAFNAYGYNVSAGEEFEIEDKGEALDLELLAFVQPIKEEI